MGGFLGREIDTGPEAGRRFRRILAILVLAALAIAPVSCHCWLRANIHGPDGDIQDDYARVSLALIARAEVAHRAAHGVYAPLDGLELEPFVKEMIHPRPYVPVDYAYRLEVAPGHFRLSATPAASKDGWCCCTLGLARREFYFIDETLVLRVNRRCRPADEHSPELRRF